ncbi:hypothetical protein TIFTF001_011290 [Ficus carica]|uniref:Uncharacterized protein n=1 Tax=Ficus carica TaxID=3494 RepID=A0AA87ZXY4_FICCA|nr:hypothetical protein TIFTF001_011290 [Ficus carica]
MHYSKTMAVTSRNSHVGYNHDYVGGYSVSLETGRQRLVPVPPIELLQLHFPTVLLSRYFLSSSYKCNLPPF